MSKVTDIDSKRNRPTKEAAQRLRDIADGLENDQIKGLAISFITEDGITTSFWSMQGSSWLEIMGLAGSLQHDIGMSCYEREE